MALGPNQMTTFVKEKDDSELLKLYADHGSKAAFTVLVERYGGLVLAVARQMAGQELGEEIAQNVFLALTKKANKLRRGALAGWLHRATVLEAKRMLRAEACHAKRVETLQAMKHAEPSSPAEGICHEVLPHLDEAILTLAQSDRDLLFLRFFEGLTFSKIFERLRINEATGRKRVSRMECP